MDIELTDQYNQFIQNYNQNASCDSECQQQQEAQQLKQNYLNAVNNLNNAPQEVQTTYQQYLNFTQGSGAYPQYQQSNLEQQAENISTEYQANFNNEMNNVKTLLSTYTGLYNNYKNIYDLNKIYTKENYELQKDIDITNTDTLTNDRKTFYENQATESLKKYYIFFSIVYGIVIMYYLRNMIKYNYHTPTAVGFLLLLIIYPFISLWLSLRLISFYNFLLDLLPKNQYKDL